MLLEIDATEVEYGAWLRKKGDFGYINVVDLDALLKGVNLAVKWGLREVEVHTDSSTVVGWLRSIVTAEKRIRTKGAFEINLKRCLEILQEMMEV